MMLLCSDSSFTGASSRPVPSAPQAHPRPGRVAIEIEVGPRATTVFVRGELDLVTMPVFAEHLTRAVQGKPERLVLDMSGTDFIDCGSSRLIALAGRALPGGGRLVIRRPGRGVRRILELTGVDALCEIDG